MADRYISAHKTPNGPGDARPTAAQIIKDEALDGGQLGGQTALITGCSAGIGVDTAKALYAAGATLFLTARDLAKARAALGDALVGDGERVHLLQLDLESFDNVRACAAEFLSKSATLNLLICNAGVMTPPEGRTKDGFETQFGTNHLSHFLLFNLLQPALLAGAATSNRASRVIVLSSLAHRFGEVNFDNFNFDGNYDPWTAYAQSKTANVWTANEIERRYGSQGVHAWSVHPGAVLTDLMRHMSDAEKTGFHEDPLLAKMFKNSEQGAATSVWAATAAALEGQGGKYLEDCRITGPWDPSVGEFGPGYATYAYDVEKATKLWNKSRELVGLQ
ncbi:short chain dehydrogenase [Hirsutella rhossiliensis]|uniref:Short chain dehydrogenase domain-containing protein n=1 Tax=Hirsutella rhossiliensis TaxID=111463 RepID=A0A9P8SLX7_9HYPO|nr:short chain dehydrogenase domain-containing protein [Hirsutella rhossiliensis]KAH0966245.1 short chain dehydrogenase domain-containing protein [Hirsutella rhossiliensis]